MNNIYMALINRVKQYIDYDVYNGQADDGAHYPYAVIKLIGIDNTEDDRDDYNLIVSVWDKRDSASHAKVVEVSELVKKAINKFNYSNENIFFYTSRANVGLVPDPDTQIKRYDVKAIIKTYRRS